MFTAKAVSTAILSASNQRTVNPMRLDKISQLRKVREQHPVLADLFTFFIQDIKPIHPDGRHRNPQQAADHFLGIRSP